VVYGPQTSLILISGDGVDMFTLDREQKIYRLIRRRVQIPTECAEYAINASNHRHWEPPVRAFIDACGADGPSGKNFNMRWIASLVAEAYRILIRGGVFLYPSDARKNYAEGRLRLLYEAHPHLRTGRRRCLDWARKSSRSRAQQRSSADTADHGVNQRGSADQSAAHAQMLQLGRASWFHAIYTA
jgi:hypothetical protein